MLYLLMVIGPTPHLDLGCVALARCEYFIIGTFPLFETRFISVFIVQVRSWERRESLGPKPRSPDRRPVKSSSKYRSHSFRRFSTPHLRLFRLLLCCCQYFLLHLSL